MAVSFSLMGIIGRENLVFLPAKFEEHEDIPCSHFGERVEWLTCLNDGNGIIGSSYIAVGERLGLIVPEASNTSFLFIINFEIKQISNPLQLELKRLLAEKERLQARRLLSTAFKITQI